MSVVYVVQMPAKRTGPATWEDKYDLSPAEAYGELKRLLPYGNLSRSPGKLNKAFSDVFEQLQSFNPAEDYILPLGDPIACSLTFICLQNIIGPVRVLKYDRRKNKYDVYSIPYA